MRERMNARIEAIYDGDQTIVHAKLIKLKDVPEEERLEKLGNIFRRQILPLLEEYFFEDWDKIRLVLGDNQKTDSPQFISVLDSGNTLKELFGTKHDLDEYTVKKRFVIQEAAFIKPQAYTGIYQ